MSEPTCIPLDKCVKGHLYRAGSRNLGLVVFDGHRGFIGIRSKFEARYLFTELHYDSDPCYGTCTPLEDLGPIPEHIPVSVTLRHDKGDEWANDPATGQRRAVIRRDLQPGEALHGKRHGFVDLWADTGERLPDRLYPECFDNAELFSWLDAKEKEWKEQHGH